VSPQPFQLGSAQLDLSDRIFSTAAVVGSPAAASETVIASVTLTQDLAVAEGTLLIGYAAFTAGTNGVSATLKLRRTGTSGTTVKTSGAVTVAAAALYEQTIVGFDTPVATPNAVYVMTLTIGSGSAESLVSAVTLIALVV
jgi:hypothetical protein